MLKKRFIRQRTRRAQKETEPLQLNSLMDILTIMLVFLIMNYTISEVELSIPKNIKIPESISTSYVKKGITVQMSDDLELWVNNSPLLQLGKARKWTVELRGQLEQELRQIRKRLENIRMRTLDAQDQANVINLIMDKNLEYTHLKELMDISSSAGYTEFKFIVIEP